jgi:hypothetical protein
LRPKPKVSRAQAARFHLAGSAKIKRIVAERLERAVYEGELDLAGLGFDSIAAPLK